MALKDDLNNSKDILKGMNQEAVEFQSTVNAIQTALKGLAKEEQSIADLIDVATKNNVKLKNVSEELATIKKALLIF